MTEEQKASVINARCATAMIRALGMKAENDQRVMDGLSIAYRESDFLKIIEEEGTHWNSIHGVLFQ